MPQRQNIYWYESQGMIAVRDLPRYTTIYYTDVSTEMQRHTWMLPFLKTTVTITPGGYCHIWAIWVCAAVKGMVFKQFTLG